MANKIKRAWFIDKLSEMGIIEEATNSVSKDGYTSNWRSITEVKDLRMYTISRDVDLSINELGETWEQIPAQFHEVLINKAVAQGYKDPRHMELKTAEYFEQEYMEGVTRARKFARSNYQTTGRIKPQDF